MPEFLERALEAGAEKKGITGERAKRYIYGAMNNLGAMHGNRETPKGRRMERKHDRKLAGLKSLLRKQKEN